jgi:hypothetical protein
VREAPAAIFSLYSKEYTKFMYNYLQAAKKKKTTKEDYQAMKLDQ